MSIVIILLYIVLYIVAHRYVTGLWHEWSRVEERRAIIAEFKNRSEQLVQTMNKFKHTRVRHRYKYSVAKYGGYNSD